MKLLINSISDTRHLKNHALIVS